MTITIFEITHKSTHTNLTLLSLNINGLSDEKKRTKLFEILINKNMDVPILQETLYQTKQQTYGKKNGLENPFGIQAK